MNRFFSWSHDWRRTLCTAALFALLCSCTLPTADITIGESIDAAAESAFLSSEDASGALALAEHTALRELDLELSAQVTAVDLSACTALTCVNLSGNGTVLTALTLPNSLRELSCSSVTPPLTALGSVETLKLSVPCNLTPLTKADALTSLSLFGEGWDPSPLKQTCLESLNLDRPTDDAVSSLAGMASLKTLQLNDRLLTDLSVLDSLPSLETLVLHLAPQGGLHGVELTAPDELDAMVTSIDLGPLKDFLARGGVIWCFEEHNRPTYQP